MKLVLGDPLSITGQIQVKGGKLDVSLNLFVFLLVGSSFLLVSLIQGVSSLVGLPRRV